jgi:hypothetical protein
LVEFSLQNLDFPLHLEHLVFELSALQGVQLLYLFRVFLDDLVVILLGPEELAFILFEETSVVVDLPFEHLIGGFIEDG